MLFNQMTSQVVSFTYQINRKYANVKKIKNEVRNEKTAGGVPFSLQEFYQLIVSVLSINCRFMEI